MWGLGIFYVDFGNDLLVFFDWPLEVIRIYFFIFILVRQRLRGLICVLVESTPG